MNALYQYYVSYYFNGTGFECRVPIGCFCGRRDKTTDIHRNRSQYIKELVTIKPVAILHGRKKVKEGGKERKKKNLAAVGFEPTPSK